MSVTAYHGIAATSGSDSGDRVAPRAAIFVVSLGVLIPHPLNHTFSCDLTAARDKTRRGARAREAFSTHRTQERSAIDTCRHSVSPRYFGKANDRILAPAAIATY